MLIRRRKRFCHFCAAVVQHFAALGRPLPQPAAAVPRELELANAFHDSSPETYGGSFALWPRLDGSKASCVCQLLDPFKILVIGGDRHIWLLSSLLPLLLLSKLWCCFEQLEMLQSSNKPSSRLEQQRSSPR